MELTGKTLSEFRKWLILSDLREQIEIFCKLKINDTISEAFFELPNSMKYGVYVDFFDSVGIVIEKKLVVNLIGVTLLMLLIYQHIGIVI